LNHSHLRSLTARQTGAGAYLRFHNTNQRKQTTKHTAETKLPWFSCLLRHSARKRGGLILQRPRAPHCVELLSHPVVVHCDVAENTKKLSSTGEVSLQVDGGWSTLSDWITMRVLYRTFVYTFWRNPSKFTSSHQWATHYLYMLMVNLRSIGFVPYHIISYHIVVLKRRNHLKVGTDKPKLKVKMQSVSDVDVWKRLLEQPRFELAAKGVFRLGRCRSL